MGGGRPGGSPGFGGCGGSFTGGLGSGMDGGRGGMGSGSRTGDFFGSASNVSRVYFFGMLPASFQSQSKWLEGCADGETTKRVPTSAFFRLYCGACPLILCVMLRVFYGLSPS